MSSTSLKLENNRVLLEKRLDTRCLSMTKTFVTLTREFSMRPSLSSRFAYLCLAAALYAPFGLLLLSRAAAMVV